MERIVVRLHGQLSRTHQVDQHHGAAHRNDVSPDAADNTRDMPPHRPNVYLTDVRKIAPRSQAKATILWRPSDGTHSRPITRTGLHLFSDDPRRPTWGHASEMVSTRMLLTTREMRYNARTSTKQTFDVADSKVPIYLYTGSTFVTVIKSAILSPLSPTRIPSHIERTNTKAEGLKSHDISTDREKIIMWIQYKLY